MRLTLRLKSCNASRSNPPRKSLSAHSIKRGGVQAYPSTLSFYHRPQSFPNNHRVPQGPDRKLVASILKTRINNPPSKKPVEMLSMRIISMTTSVMGLQVTARHHSLIPHLVVEQKIMLPMVPMTLLRRHRFFKYLKWV